MKYSDTEVFSIQVGSLLGLADNNAVSVLYSPLQDEVALVDADDEFLIRNFFENGVMPDKVTLQELIDEFECKSVTSLPVPTIRNFTRLSLLPNSTCNFSCSYCYSAQGRGSTVISWEKARSALNYFIDPSRISPQDLFLFISGGGEPLVSWNITHRIIEYSYKRAEELGFTLHISIITNGSLLTDEIVEELKQYNCTVCVSFEVLEHLQNVHRKNFSIVDANIRRLERYGVRVMLNSTVIPQSVEYMTDMVRAVAEHYPYIAQYTMEPVTGISNFETARELHSFYDRFYENYLAAKNLAKALDVNLRFTFDDALRGTTVRHCPGKFCLTPQGTISICHLVSSPKEDRYEKCIYGQFNEDGTLKLNEEKFAQLYNQNVLAYERCTDCFAKWTCGGECMTRNDTYSEKYMEEVCRFNRRFVLHLLMERIEKSVMEECSMTLKQYVYEEFE